MTIDVDRNETESYSRKELIKYGQISERTKNNSLWFQEIKLGSQMALKPNQNPRRIWEETGRI